MLFLTNQGGIHQGPCNITSHKCFHLISVQQVISIAWGEKGSANKLVLPRKATIQKTGKSGSAYSPHVRSEDLLHNRRHGKCKAKSM